MKTFNIFFIFIILAACTHLAQNTKQSNDPILKILFVGSSYLYCCNMTNSKHEDSSKYDLPSLLAYMASSRNHKTIIKFISFPGSNLRNLWDESDIQDILQREEWDIVVLQEGVPSDLPIGLESHRYLQNFIKLAGEQGARSYLVDLYYEKIIHQDLQDFYHQFFARASRDENIQVFNINLIWNQFYMKHKEISLLKNDGWHLTAAGTYFLAGLIYEKLFPKEIWTPQNIQQDAHYFSLQHSSPPRLDDLEIIGQYLLAKQRK